MGEPRFEIVRTNAGYHARFVGGNGETVWTTEVYRRDDEALRAIELVTGRDVKPNTAWTFDAMIGDDRLLEVRAVDERGTGG